MQIDILLELSLALLQPQPNVSHINVPPCQCICPLLGLQWLITLNFIIAQYRQIIWIQKPDKIFSIKSSSVDRNICRKG